MKPLFPRLHERLEKAATTKPRQPIRFACIVFAILFVLCELGAIAAYGDTPPERQRLSPAELLILPPVAAFWYTLIATGWFLLSVEAKRSVFFTLIPFQFACFVLAFSFWGLFVLVGVKAMAWIPVVCPIMVYLIGAVLISWTLIAAWGWVRFARGHALN
jgi:hypothetical protein